MKMGSQEITDPFIFVGPFIHSKTLKTLEYVEGGVIVVCSGKITCIEHDTSKLAELKKKYQVLDKNVFKLNKNQFLIPGFIDAHIHAPQYPNNGLGYDLPLLQWLEKYTFPLEKKFSEPSFAEKVYNAVVKKTLSCGTTTACYFATIHTPSSLILAKCIKNLGQRAFVGKVNMNKNTPEDYGETFEESVAETKKFIEGVEKLGCPLIKPIITPRFALSCDMKLMTALGKIANDHNLYIQTHISENLEEICQVKKHFSECKNYLDVYDTAGLLNNRTVLAHGIHLTPEELEVIKKKQASIVHCALSNVLLESGVCPVKRYLDAGLKVSIGTDCSGGCSCSVLDSIRQSLFLSIQTSFHNPKSALSYEEVFYMATLGGAQALGLENTTGNFTPQKDFDAVLVDLNNMDLLEDYNLKQLFQKLIYSGDDRVIRKVFVAGKVVLDNTL